MKKWLAVLLLVGTGASPSGAEELILINFGTSGTQVASPDEEGRSWNNAVWNGEGHTSDLSLVTTAGGKTGIQIRVLKPFFGGFDVGNNPQNLYPAEAGNSRWSLEKGAVEEAQLRVTGLSPDVKYDFFFFGTREAPIQLATRYEIGNRGANLVNSRNRGQLASIRGVEADGSGAVTIRVTLALDTHNGFLNVMEIRYPEKKEGSSPAPEKPQEVKQEPKPQPNPKPEPAPTARPNPAPSAPSADEGNSLYLISGVIFVLLGLGVVAGSVWYYIK